jgi:hypothetical protein
VLILIPEEPVENCVAVTTPVNLPSPTTSSLDVGIVEPIPTEPSFLMTTLYVPLSVMAI